MRCVFKTKTKQNQKNYYHGLDLGVLITRHIHVTYSKVTIRFIVCRVVKTQDKTEDLTQSG